MTLLETINRIKLTALGLYPDKQLVPRLLDTNVLIEILLPRCIDVICNEVANNQDQLTTLRQNFIVPFVDGIGDLPPSVKEEWLGASYVFSGPTGIIVDQNACYVQKYTDLLNPNDPLYQIYDAYSVQGQKIYYRQATSGFAGFTQNVTFSFCVIPALPAVATDEFVIDETNLQKLIIFVASIIVGDISLKEIGLDFIDLEEENAEQ